MTIRRYPSRLASTYVLADGTRIAIRPIRPEDAALERAFVNSLSDRSRYLRFMYFLKRITPEMISRFTQIDYDREMALVAIVQSDGEERQIAVARYASFTDDRGCEFAIVVADDWHGRGIASELLRRLIEIARDRGLEVMQGIVLRENRDMIALARNLGFEEETVREDPSLVRVTLRL